MIDIGLALAICTTTAGRKLSRKRAGRRSYVMAGVECRFLPFGTVLGGFTIVMLLRPGVKEIFGRISQAFAVHQPAVSAEVVDNVPAGGQLSHDWPSPIRAKRKRAGTDDSDRVFRPCV
ncbi:MAG: hypothetical protein R3C10_13405 [Pirellulales bacterium]